MARNTDGGDGSHKDVRRGEPRIDSKVPAVILFGLLVALAVPVLSNAEVGGVSVGTLAQFIGGLLAVIGGVALLRGRVMNSGRKD